MFKKIKDYAVVSVMGALAFSPVIWSLCCKPYSISGKILSVEKLPMYGGELNFPSGRFYKIDIDREQREIFISEKRLGQRTLQEGKDISLKVQPDFPLFGNGLIAVDVDYIQ